MDGVRWRRLEGGTTLDIVDIWGVRNLKSGNVEIIALASNFNVQIQENKVLQIIGDKIISIDNTGLTSSLRGIWFVPGKSYYLIGAGIYRKRVLSELTWSRYSPGEVTFYYSGGVRGTNVNDIFIAGSFREKVHFNGYSWYRYLDLNPGSSGSFGPIAMKGDLVITVGLYAQYAIVAIGRR